MTPDAGTGQAGEHARGGLPELLGLLDLEGIDTDLFRSRASTRWTGFRMGAPSGAGG
jgi:hypothetical protein